MEPSIGSLKTVCPMPFSEFSTAMNKMLVEKRNDNFLVVYRMFQFLKYVEVIPEAEIRKIKQKLILRKIEYYPLLQLIDLCILPVEKRNCSGRAKQYAIHHFNYFGNAFQHRPELDSILNANQKPEIRIKLASVAFYLLDKKHRTSIHFRNCLDLFIDHYRFHELNKYQVIGILNALLLFPKSERATVLNQCISATAGNNTNDIRWKVFQILFDLKTDDNRKNFVVSYKEYCEFNKDVKQDLILSVLDVYKNYAAKEQDYISFHTIAAIVSNTPRYLKYQNASAKTIIEAEFYRCFKDVQDIEEIKDALMLWTDFQSQFSDKVLYFSFVAKGVTLIRIVYNSVKQAPFITKLIKEFKWLQNKKMILEYEYSNVTSLKLLEFFYPPFTDLFSVLPSKDLTHEYFSKLLIEFNLIDNSLKCALCRNINLISIDAESFTLERLTTFFASINKKVSVMDVEKCEYVYSILIPEMFLHSAFTKRFQIDCFMRFMENLNELSSKEVSEVEIMILNLKKYSLNFDQLLRLSIEIIRNIQDTQYLTFLFDNFEFFFPAKIQHRSDDCIACCLSLIINRKNAPGLCAAISYFAEKEKSRHLTVDQLMKLSKTPPPMIKDFSDFHRVIQSRYPYAKIQMDFLNDLQNYLFTYNWLANPIGTELEQERIAQVERFCLANYTQIGPLLRKWKSHKGHKSNQDILMVSNLLLPLPYRNYKGRHAMYDLIDRGLYHEGFLLKGIELLRYIQSIPVEERVDLL